MIKNSRNVMPRCFVGFESTKPPSPETRALYKPVGTGESTTHVQHEDFLWEINLVLQVLLQEAAQEGRRMQPHVTHFILEQFQRECTHSLKRFVDY